MDGLLLIMIAEHAVSLVILCVNLFILLKLHKWVVG